mgnify:CR=1 FL=1
MQLLSQYTDAIFDQLRLKQDLLADQAVQVLVSNPQFAKEINSWESIPTSIPDNFPEELHRYFDFYLDKEKEFLITLMRKKYFEEKIYLLWSGIYGNKENYYLDWNSKVVESWIT